MRMPGLSSATTGGEMRRKRRREGERGRELKKAVCEAVDQGTRDDRYLVSTIVVVVPVPVVGGDGGDGRGTGTFSSSPLPEASFFRIYRI